MLGQPSTVAGFEVVLHRSLTEPLGVDFRPYVILGACNPGMAYKALQAEEKIGTMLPCNVILQQRQDGRTEISAVDPVASMQAINNKELARTAGEVGSMLRQVIEELGTGGSQPRSAANA